LPDLVVARELRPSVDSWSYVPRRYVENGGRARFHETSIRRRLFIRELRLGFGSSGASFWSVSARLAIRCGYSDFRVVGLRPYRGLFGARNWELIQPFQLGFSTWTQSPSRLVAVNRVPLGAVPRTGAFPEGADLMFTPGRCKKTRSRFGVTAPGATWGEASAVRGGGNIGRRWRICRTPSRS
jgi:hypothetical protein